MSQTEHTGKHTEPHLAQDKYSGDEDLLFFPGLTTGYIRNEVASKTQNQGE